MNNNIITPTLCPHCNNYPLLYLNKDNPKEIIIQCPTCGFNQYYSIHHYLNRMKKEKNATDNKNNCPKHNKEFIKYCLTCKMHFCDICNHRSHAIINLSNEVLTNILIDKIKEAYEHINNYGNELKTNLINDLTKQLNKFQFQKQINRIEPSFQSFQSINNNIFQILQLIIYNYTINHHSYFLRYNLNSINYLNQ